jgi:hypothetical protein
MRGISKARLGPNRLGGCCIWLTVSYVIIFTGIAHFMYEALGDACPNLELIVEANAPASFELGDTNITNLGGKLTSALDCQQGQTFVGLLGADQVFNTSGKVEAIFTSVDAAIVGISNSTGQLDDAIVQAESAKEGFSKSVTGGSGVAFDAPALVAQITDAKTKCNGTDDTSSTYLWTYNRSQVENCRAVLPAWWARWDPSTPTSARWLACRRRRARPPMSPSAASGPPPPASPPSRPV